MGDHGIIHMFNRLPTDMAGGMFFDQGLLKVEGKSTRFARFHANERVQAISPGLSSVLDAIRAISTGADTFNELFVGIQQM